VSKSLSHNSEAKSHPDNQPFWPQVGFWLQKSILKISNSKAVTGLLLSGIFILLLGLIQFSTPNLPGNDGYYHIKLASIMRSEGLKPAFPWLPLTILNPREYYDHHFLYHVFLVPFTYGDLRIGAKWSAVIFASVAFLCIWLLLDKQHVPYAPLWALGLMAVSEAFLFRMSIPRAQSLSLAILAIGLHWLLTGKHFRLIWLGFIFVWLYNAFPLLLGIAGAYVLAVWLTERRLNVLPLVYSSVGIALGLILNPYFPYNLIFVFQHIVPKLLETTAINVGNEWFPYSTGQLLSNSPLGLLAFISGILALGLVGRRMDARTATAFLLVCLFGLMLFQSRRFIEYFPAFALIFAAFSWSPLIDRSKYKGSSLDHNEQEIPAIRTKWSLKPTILFIFLVPGMWITFNAAKANLQHSTPHQRYASASAWLEANTLAGERVFQTDWDDFPLLFFHNTYNTYLVGLDPTYMQLYDAELYDLWVDITQGRVENLADVIPANFGAFYVLTDLQHEGFLNQAEKDPLLVEVYRDSDAVIFQVIEN
jgi:hypothetical protein